MPTKNTEQLAYVLQYNLPVRSIVPVSDDVKVKFTMTTPTSNDAVSVEYDVVENNLQSLIDEFFQRVIQENLSFIIVDLDDQIEYDIDRKVTTVNIKVLLIGMNSLKFIDCMRKVN